MNSMTTTSNGALSNADVGAKTFARILEYFSKSGTYTNRSQNEVDKDMKNIFADDELYALRMLFALRLITREPSDLKGNNQSGYGRRDEFFKAMTWLIKEKPELFYKNFHLIPTFGCWKDIFTTPLISLIDPKKSYSLVQEGLSKNDQLLLKYLPQIRSVNKIRSERDRARSEWAKGFCKFAKIGYKAYRKLKSGGVAHVWQQQMSSQEWDKIHFNGIPGKAMFLHTTQKGKDGITVFERHGQTNRLSEWLLSQASVKFTGYVYELYQAACKQPTLLQKLVLNRQFEKILEPMRGHNLGNVLCCLDSSMSMTWNPPIPNVTAYDICMSLGLAFSSLNIGSFQDTVCRFGSHSELIKLTGSFCDKVDQISKAGGMGGTNFQSVIDALVKYHKTHPNVPVSEYPETLLICSDMQMNIAGDNSQTNYELAMKKLNDVGLNNIRVIWWHLNSAHTQDFPSKMEDKNVFMISGFDPVNLKTLMGLSTSEKSAISNDDQIIEIKEEKEKTPLDGMFSILNQKIFERISI